jgi:uncharacterized membrane protein YfcA
MNPQDLLALPIGVLVGVILGALGGGGAIVAVPALVYLLNQPAHAATTASLVIVIVSASAGVVGHWRAGRVRVGSAVAFAAAGLVGSFIGSRASGAANPDALLLGFAALMLLVAGLMYTRQRQAAPSPARRLATAGAGAGGGGGAPSVSSVPGLSARIAELHGPPHYAVIVIAATAIGFLTGLFGVGGGIIVVPALVLVMGFEMPVAVGTSLVVIILNSVAALAARVAGHATFDWPLIAVFTAAAIGGVLVGNRVADRADARRLTQGFIVLVVAVATYTAARSLLHLV